MRPLAKQRGSLPFKADCQAHSQAGITIGFYHPKGRLPRPLPIFP